MPKALPPIPLREDIQMSKCLSAKALLKSVRKTFSKIPEHRAGNVEYSLVDTLMSGLAVFGLNFPSLLKFDENRQEAHIRHNLQTLYGVPESSGYGAIMSIHNLHTGAHLTRPM